MEYSKVNWVDAKIRLPTVEEYGPYPSVLVALACKNHEADWGFQYRFADLRFFGGDVTRPYWAGNKSEGCKPIENDAWYVAYWAPMFQSPLN